MPYNFFAESFHTKKFYSTLSSQEVELSPQKMANFRSSVPIWRLRDNVHCSS